MSLVSSRRLGISGGAWSSGVLSDPVALDSTVNGVDGGDADEDGFFNSSGSLEPLSSSLGGETSSVCFAGDVTSSVSFVAAVLPSLGDSAASTGAFLPS